MNIFKKIIKWLKKSCCSNDLIVDEYQNDYFYTVKSEDSLSYSDSLFYSDSLSDSLSDSP